MDEFCGIVAMIIITALNVIFCIFMTKGYKHKEESVSVEDECLKNLMNDPDVRKAYERRCLVAKKIGCRCILAIEKYGGHYILHQIRDGMIIMVIDLNKPCLISHKLSFTYGDVDMKALRAFAKEYNVDIHYLLEGDKNNANIQK